jgi:hypothetical protein
MKSLIVPIFKNGDKNIPSNYRTIMISPILAKLYGIIFKKKIYIWLESHGKRAKGQAEFRRYHSTMDHLVTFRIIADELCNTKAIFFVVLLSLKNLLTWFLGKTFGIGWKR